MKKKVLRFLIALSIITCMVLSLGLTAYATEAPEPDSSVVVVEPETAAQPQGPNTLILHLGPEWAAIQFEVTSDSGGEPQFARVSPEGTLTIDLDGGYIYTLSIDESSLPEDGAPETAESGQKIKDDSDAGEKDSTAPNVADEDVPEESDTLLPGVPNLHLFLFGGGLLLCIGGLVTMAILKRRRQNIEYDDDEDDYE